jgi:hypothetical protein
MHLKDTARAWKLDFSLLILLWGILTFLNLGKAFHIDDTFYLEAAEWIKRHPLQPMSGLVNWGDDATAIYTHNQPPILFYLIALVSGFFGNGEVPLHLMLSCFSFLALFFFYRITVFLSLQYKRILLVLFALCPAFVVNQNLMTDIPILAMLMGTAFFLLKAGKETKWINYSLAALFFGIGLMIKYALMPVFVVLLIVILIRRDFTYLAVLLIPAAIVIGWSLWNYHEFGAIHMFGRSKGSVHIKWFWAYLACLGAVSAYSVSFLSGVFSSGFLKKTVYASMGIFALSIGLFAAGILTGSTFSKSLNYAFIANGLFVCFGLFMVIIKRWRHDGFVAFIQSDHFTVLLFFLAISGFVILFTPFLATRHVLLVIPFALLSGYELLMKSDKTLLRISIALTVISGISLGIADWHYADYYRKMASQIELPENKVIWAAGHWGWQWYATQQGMKQYGTKNSAIKAGDYLIYPGDISIQEFNDSLKFTVIDKKWEEGNFLTFLSVHQYASMYISNMENPPWSFSKMPMDTIYICRID